MKKLLSIALLLVLWGGARVVIAQSCSFVCCPNTTPFVCPGADQSGVFVFCTNATPGVQVDYTISFTGGGQKLTGKLNSLTPVVESIYSTPSKAATITAVFHNPGKDVVRTINIPRGSNELSGVFYLKWAGVRSSIDTGYVSGEEAGRILLVNLTAMPLHYRITYPIPDVCGDDIGDIGSGIITKLAIAGCYADMITVTWPTTGPGAGKNKAEESLVGINGEGGLHKGAIIFLPVSATAIKFDNFGFPF
jgi:hypothetical protein